MNHSQIAETFEQALGLRWSPVAVRLLRPGEPIPDGVVPPSTPLRYCQSIMAARRGNCLYMPPRWHACPDGTGILGLTEMAPKLKSGELYLLFKKMPSIERAQEMISQRPQFEPGDFTATVVAPLEKATFEPDVVVFTVWPEQAMWLSCARTYSSGRRQSFNTSGYNSVCADITAQTMKTGEMNISFGCYGARASSDITDFELFVSIPYSQLPPLAEALIRLSAKSIPEERRKIYMPPVMDNVSRPGAEEEREVSVVIDLERCSGCGLCEAFCPGAVFEMAEAGDGPKAQAVRPEGCSACYTCVGQCPEKAIQLR